MLFTGGTAIPKQETWFGSKVVGNNIFPRLRSPSTETAVDYLEEAQTIKNLSFVKNDYGVSRQKRPSQ